MNLRDITRYVSSPAKVVMVLAALLFGVLCAEGIIVELIWELRKPQYRRSDSDRPKLTEAQARQERIRKSQKKFMADGTVHLLREVFSGERYYRGPSEERQIEVYDTNHKLLWSGKRRNSPYRYLSFIHYRKGWGRQREFLTETNMITPEFSKSLIIPVLSGDRRIAQRWRYEPGRDYLIGYGPRGDVIGYVGANGVTTSSETVQRFAEPQSIALWVPAGAYAPELLWQTKRRLYRINFAEGSVEVLFDIPSKEIAATAIEDLRSVPRDANDYPMISLVTSSGECHVLLRGPSKRLTFTMPTEWNPELMRTSFSGEVIFLEYYGREGRPVGDDLQLWKKWIYGSSRKPRKRWVELRRVDADGVAKLVSRFDWTEQARLPKPTVAARKNLREITREYATSLSPPLMTLAWRWYYEDVYLLARYGGRRQSMFDIMMDEVMRNFQPGKLWLNWILGLLMVGVAFWHGWARRTSWARFVFWLVFVAAFNLAGLLTYLALNHTPVIHCPACGKRRGLEKPTCPACNAALPAPEKRDIDLIFTTGRQEPANLAGAS